MSLPSRPARRRRLPYRALVPLALALAAGCSRTHETASAGTASGTPPLATAAAASAGATAQPGSSAAIVARADSSRIRGNTGATVWMREISDFQCPYCKMFHDSAYHVIQREYVDAGKVRLAYVNFPLTSIHPNAQGAAEAAMCAGAQGRFWQMHDALFDDQGDWERLPDPTMRFVQLAARVGADTSAFHRCVAQHTMRPLVDADAERAREAGVRSTPTFIIGDSVIAGAAPLAEFRRVLDAVVAGSARAGAR